MIIVKEKKNLFWAVCKQSSIVPAGASLNKPLGYNLFSALVPSNSYNVEGNFSPWNKYFPNVAFTFLDKSRGEHEWDLNS